ncbi:MAG: PH domain-containing protein [Verrucomicrobia bacterium]|nr:PH domain-containing protein [Verrucomicrobiota bacterium]
MQQNIQKAKVSLLSYSLPSVLFMGLVAIVFIAVKLQLIAILWLIIIIPYIIVRACLIGITHKVAIVGNAVELRNGFFNKATTNIRLRNIESVELHQGFLGRLLDYGALKFNGTGGDKNITPVIKNPERFKNTLREHLDKIQG